MSQNLVIYDPSKEKINTKLVFEFIPEGDKLRIKSEYVNCLLDGLHSNQFDDLYNQYYLHLNLDFSPLEHKKKSYNCPQKSKRL